MYFSVFFLNNVVDDSVQCGVAVIFDVCDAAGDAVWIARFVSVFILNALLTYVIFPSFDFANRTAQLFKS